MRRAAQILLSLLLFLQGFTCLGQVSHEEFRREEFISCSGDTIPYRILEPKDKVEGKRYPLILFLHGAGERGNDNKAQLTHGAEMFLDPELRAKYPAFVIFPQCPKDGYWAYGNRPDSFTPESMPEDPPLTKETEALRELLESYMGRNDVHYKKVYIIGLSMGGMATYDMAIRYGDIVAAAVPICGTVNPERLKSSPYTGNIAWRIFHGDADPVVTVEGSRQAAKVLKDMGAPVEYIEIPGCGHESWKVAFQREDFLQWLFAQKKTSPFDSNYRNFDESKVPPYTLEDPLTFKSGRKVRSVRQWRRRRSELIGMFEREMYGKAPVGKPSGMRFEVVSEDRNAFGGKATRREVDIHLSPESRQRIRLLVYIPNNRTGKVPAFLGQNFCGNQTAEPGGADSFRWEMEYVVSRGYATATYFCGDVDPDFDDGFHNGVHGLFGPKERKGGDWATFAAWAWGLSRALDYLQTDPDIDGSKVIVHGHSRMGKTALWAGALDERFAAVISNSSGCGGAALSKRWFGQTVKDIQQKFPHWFCASFRKYSDNEASLPFDQHELLSLIAPRPLYVQSGADDRGSDPLGEFLGLCGAAPVYALYGLHPIKGDTLPPVESPILTDCMGHHIRRGGHQILLYDWVQYCNFADSLVR